MEVIDHFKTVLVASPIAVYFLYGVEEPIIFGLLTLYGIGAGVLIDLDHFLLARWFSGDWRHLESAVRNPLKIVTDCQEVVDEDWIGEEDDGLRRLKTHSLITVAGTGLTYLFVEPRFAALTAVCFLTHITGDLYARYSDYGDN